MKSKHKKAHKDEFSHKNMEIIQIKKESKIKVKRRDEEKNKRNKNNKNGKKEMEQKFKKKQNKKNNGFEIRKRKE